MHPFKKPFRVKIFADGADIASIRDLVGKDWIAGFTTNPSLVRKAGVTDYRQFARDVIAATAGKPISFEVLADDFATMEAQALDIAAWGKNVYVKIPVTNSRNEFSGPLIQRLAKKGVSMNVTAILANEDVDRVCAALKDAPRSIISIFAGRIADTGVDPEPTIQHAVHSAKKLRNCEVLWASTREVYNVLQADRSGCQIITMTADLLKKLPLFGKDLRELTLETVKMFVDDAKAAGLTLTNDAPLKRTA